MRRGWLALTALAWSACCVPVDGCTSSATPSGAALFPSIDGEANPTEIVGEPEGERLRSMRGYCASPRSANRAERVQTAYSGALRGQGSAPSLRGKVALVTVMVETPRRKWTRARKQRWAAGAAQARSLMLREARRYGVADLSIDLATMDATSVPLLLPPLETDGFDRLEPDTVAALESEVHRAAQTALGASLEQIAGSFRAQGYRSVAFLAAFPFELRARDFALSESGYFGRDAELAFVFAGMTAGPLSYAIAHESLHLFGAEDLYALTTVDPADRRDVMQVYCATAGASVIAGTTAWAIGWRDRPPPRSYAIDR